MRWTIILGGIPLLAACSEQQICISKATKDLRVVQGFVAESEGNLSRGYALVTVEKIGYEREECGVHKDGSKRFCRVPYTYDTQEPRAIDLDAEATKLASLRKKEASLQTQATASIAACKSAYPEG